MTAEKEIFSTKFPHPPTLVALGLTAAVDRLFQNIDFDPFLKLRSSTRPRVTLEFLSSLSREGETLHFRLMNTDHSLSFHQINNILDWPDDGHVTPLQFSKDFPEFDPPKFWASITDSAPYNSRANKATKIIHPALRIAHRILACALFCKFETGMVSIPELFWLWAMTQPLLPSGRPVVRFNGAAWLVDRFFLAAQAKSHQVCCGGMICIIAALPPLSLPPPSDSLRGKGPTALDLDSLLRMNWLKPGPENGKFTWFVGTDEFCTLPHPDLSTLDKFCFTLESADASEGDEDSDESGDEAERMSEHDDVRERSPARERAPGDDPVVPPVPPPPPGFAYVPADFPEKFTQMQADLLQLREEVGAMRGEMRVITDWLISHHHIQPPPPPAQ